MAKYNKELVKKVCYLIETDTYTIKEICNICNISKTIFYRWLKNKVDFVNAIKTAKNEFNSNVLVECEKSLVKLIKGYTIQEKKIVTVDSGEKDNNGKQIPKIKEQTIIDKHIQPSLGAIIHFQTNKDPENWKNKQNMELTGKDGKDLIPTMYVIGDDDFIKEFNEKLQAEQATGNEHSDNKT